MVAVCAIPSLNQFFVGYVLAGSATGGRSCVVLSLTKGADVAPEVRTAVSDAFSVDLNVVLATTNTVFAYPKGSDHKDGILLIPLSATTKFAKCQSGRN